MEFYNQLYPGDATSAGTIVDSPGQKLKERGPAVEVVIAMRKHGLDISENVRTQLVPEMLEKYDKIIVLAEPESIPEYLKMHSKAEIWDVEDIRGKTVEEAGIILDEIKRRVFELAQKLHHKS